MFIPRICQTLYLSTHLQNKPINKIANKITVIWKIRISVKISKMN